METVSFKFRGDVKDVLEIFGEERYPFLLESSLRSSRLGRYSFLGFNPFDVFAASTPDALERLRARTVGYGLSTQEQQAAKPWPFCAGWVGYVSYDWALRLENTVPCAPKDSRPGCFFCFYPTVIIVDHARGELSVVASGLPQRTVVTRRQQARLDLAAVTRRLKAAEDAGSFSTKRHRCRNPAAKETCSRPRTLTFTSDFSRAEYLAAVRRAKRYIAAGDIYQVNLSQRLSCDFPAGKNPDPLWLYRCLSEVSPACFSGYLSLGDWQILSSSPERFLCLRGKLVETRPMKGTRPRGRSPSADRVARSGLARSVKEKAELLMVTDLLRNDLGRVCRPGSIEVPALRSLEPYRSVWQATSTVTGELADGRDGFDLLTNCLPGGSVTGCPKIRALRIISELEPVPRFVYTGAMGYINFNGDMDFNVLIRTMVREPSRISFHVGGGVVADSSSAAEYEETLVKAVGMKQALALACVEEAGRLD